MLVSATSSLPTNAVRREVVDLRRYLALNVVLSLGWEGLSGKPRKIPRPLRGRQVSLPTHVEDT